MKYNLSLTKRTGGRADWFHMTLKTFAIALVALATTASGQTPSPAPTPVPPPDDVAAPPADAKKTASGLVFKILTPGKGTTHPAKSDIITVHYSGWTTKGKFIASSLIKNQPATFKLERALPGWIEGVQLMVAGEKRRFWMPQELAYQGRGRKMRGTLVFDVELISFTPSPTPSPKETPSNPPKAPTGLF